MNSIKQRFDQLTGKEKQAFWLSLVMAAAMVRFSMVTVQQLSQAADWLTLVVYMLPLLLAVTSLISAALIFFRRPALAGFLFVAGNTSSVILVPVSIEGMGFLIAVLYFVVCLYYATLVIPARTLRWYPFVNGFLALFAVLLDVFWPFPRHIASLNDMDLVQIVSVGILVVFLVFLLREFQNFTLRNKLITTSLFLSILPMTMVGILANQKSQAALTRNADESLTTTASQVAAGVDFFFLMNLESLETEAQFPDFIAILKMTPQERRSSPVYQNAVITLLALAQKSSFISSYALIDANGLVIADTARRGVGQDKSGMLFFQEAVETKKAFLLPFGYSSPENKPSIFFSAPVKNEWGDVIGVLRARYDAAVLQEMLDQQEKFEPGGLFGLVVTGEDLLVASSDGPGDLYKFISPMDSGRLQDMKASGLLPASASLEEVVVNLPDLAWGLRNSRAQPNFSGELRASNPALSAESAERAGVAGLKRASWYVVVGQPEAVLLAPVREQRRAVLLVGVSAAVLAIVFALMVAWFLAEPLWRLASAANQLATGDLSARALVKTNDEVGALADTFNAMAEQLSEFVATLEQRVASRTKALATSAEVSRRLSTILDANDLVEEVVEQLKESFNYYHVQVYLFDEQRQSLVLACAAGEAKRELLARGHRIAPGAGVVGRAAETLTPILVKDVTQAPGWSPDPLLPGARSEAAVPIMVGQHAFGVLDVQQDQAGALQQEEADLLQAIANQVAVALQNAHRYMDARRKAEREALISAIGQRIQMTGSPEEALKVAVREVGRALGGKDVYVRLGAPEREDR